MLKRSIYILTTASLLLVAIASLYRVYEFGQQRFFTIDEYQFGHATWLVSQGQKPYVDFYEHHFPLSYVLHSVFFLGEPSDASFETLALRLRKIVFVYILIACLLAGIATHAATRDPHEALLASFLPITFGFGLMSAIDYRADTLAGFAFLCCLFLLELNRGWRLRVLAIWCGAMAMLCALMTQKMAAMGGGAIALMIGVDVWRRFVRRNESGVRPLITSPVAFAIAAGSVLVVAVGVAAGLGMLRQTFDITIVQSLQHEALYPEQSIGAYLEPFVSATWYSTLPIALFALSYCFTSSAGFWLCPLLAAIGVGALLQAQYPYNYVFVSYLIALCAVRGFSQLARRIPLGGGAREAARPLLYLLPLVVVPAQLGFVSHTTSNQHQLAILNKIQSFSSDADAVIDNCGGALFRDHGSYYYQHGKFHREIFEPYFRNQLVEDYRRSRALFWIKDMRFKHLPEPVREYFESHYVRVDGDLWGLGFAVPPFHGEKPELEIDVVRDGYYDVIPPAMLTGDTRRGKRRLPPQSFWLDGELVRSHRLHLSEGRHRIALTGNSPGFLLSLVPPSAFADRVPDEDEVRLRHTILFEYDQADGS